MCIAPCSCLETYLRHLDVWQPGWSFWLRATVSHLPALSKTCLPDRKSIQPIQTPPEKIHFWKIDVVGKIQIIWSLSFFIFPSLPKSSLQFVYFFSVVSSISPSPCLARSLLEQLCQSQQVHNKRLFFSASSVAEDARNIKGFEDFLDCGAVIQAGHF